MQKVFIIVIMMSLGLFSSAFANANMDREVQIHELFKHDWETKKVRYFQFGIAPVKLNPKVRQALKDRYHITYQSMGCMIDQKYMTYNQMVDENLQKEYKKSLAQIVKELQEEFPDSQLSK